MCYDSKSYGSLDNPFGAGFQCVLSPFAGSDVSDALNGTGDPIQIRTWTTMRAAYA